MCVCGGGGGGGFGPQTPPPTPPPPQPRSDRQGSGPTAAALSPRRRRRLPQEKELQERVASYRAQLLANAKAEVRRCAQAVGDPDKEPRLAFGTAELVTALLDDEDAAGQLVIRVFAGSEGEQGVLFGDYEKTFGTSGGVVLSCSPALSRSLLRRVPSFFLSSSPLYSVLHPVAVVRQSVVGLPTLLASLHLIPSLPYLPL